MPFRVLQQSSAPPLGGHHFADANDATLCFKLYVARRATGVVQMQFRLDRGLSGLRGNHSLDMVNVWLFGNDVRTSQKGSREPNVHSESIHILEKHTTTLHSCPSRGQPRSWSWGFALFQMQPSVEP